MKHTIIGLLSLAFAGLFVGQVSADIKVSTRPTCTTAIQMEAALTALGEILSQTTGMIDGGFVEIWIGAETYSVVARSPELGTRCVAAFGMLEGEGV